jgi:hypothetical protein
MENPIYLSTVPCSFHCCRIRWAHRPFLEPVAVEPIVRRRAAKKVILAACKADLNSSDYIYIYIHVYIYMYVCMWTYVCVHIYIFCNVLMDGMEWNGMAWKGREGNGIVDRQLIGNPEHQFLRPPPLAAEPLTHEARCGWVVKEFASFVQRSWDHDALLWMVEEFYRVSTILLVVYRILQPPTVW